MVSSAERLVRQARIIVHFFFPSFSFFCRRSLCDKPLDDAVSDAAVGACDEDDS